MNNRELENIPLEFEQMLNHIKGSQRRAYRQVNSILIDLYWYVGKTICEKVEKEAWGKGVVKQLASYIAQNAPELKGFSDKNLWRMKQFYETYHGDEKLSTLLREISWSHNLTIFSRCKIREEQEFYLNLCVSEKYSVRELDRQISSSYFERSQLNASKLSTVMRELPEQAKSIFKDNYVLEFLGLPQARSESDLQKELIKQMKNFVLELGKDFLFIDQEYKVQVGNSDFFIDLLFYHRGLQCLVAFELKTDKFKPEHIGQLNFYLETLDRDVKKEYENPSIGVLLCRDKDEEVVDYALSRNLSPAMIAQYQLQLPDKKLLQNKLNEIWEQENDGTHE